MRPFGSPKALARRRNKALDLLDTGLSLRAVADQVGCSPNSVMLWRNLRKEKGDGVFEVRTPPGRPARLSARQIARLKRLLLKGPLAHGFRTDLWNTQRIADVIESEFGIRYHRDHIGRLMHRIGWSWQKPERRALERDEAEIERWKREQWPRVKKTPKSWAPTSSS
jgi:transposase